MKNVRATLALLTALGAVLLFTGKAQAEDWELKATIPLGFKQVKAVNSNGVVALTANNEAFRWSETGGMQQIASAVGESCSIGIAGISDEGVILGNRLCWTNSGTQQTHQMLAWTSQSGNTPTTPLAGNIRPDAIAPNGKFIATDTHGTAFNQTDDTLVTGEANEAPQTGALLLGSTSAGSGVGIDRAPDGTTLASRWTSTDLNIPPAFYRDGLLSGPNFIRGSETFEQVFGLTPDERVLARVAGPSSDPDPATDIDAMKLMVYDGTSGSEVPLSAGGMTATRDQRFLPGGGSKAIFATATGGGVPAGDAAVVAWSRPTDPPHALPMFFEAFEDGRSSVTPAAASHNGAWLVLSNGEVWFDKEWELGIGPEKLVVPDQVKTYAFEQQQYYEDQIQYWQQKQKTTIGVVGPFAYFNPVILFTMAVGEVGQGVEFTVAIQNRDYWATVALDPPDPKWRTVASAPTIRLSKLKRPRNLAAAKFALVKEFIGARLSLLANHICAVDAINRGATAFDNDSPDKMQAQYAAGAKCSVRAAAAARKSAQLAPRATPVIDQSLTKALKALDGRKKPLSGALWKKQVNRRVAQITRLIDLPESLVRQMKSRLAKQVKPGKKSFDAYNALAGRKASTHDGGTAKSIGKVGDAFERHADQTAD